MAAVLSGSTRALAAQVNVSMLGGIEVGAAGQFQSLAKKAAPTVAESNQYVSSSLLPDSGTTIIKALNVLNKKAGEAAPAGASGSVQFKLSDSSFGSNSAYSISGDVLSVAIVTASGDFHSDAAVTANKLKTVSDAAIGGAFAVTGLTNVAALTASGDLHSDAAVTAAKMKLSGEAAIGGALTVTGVTNVAALTASGDLHSDASVTAAKMKLSGEAEVGGALTVTGVTNVAALTASGDLHSDAAVTANKLETVGNATIGGVLLGEGIISGSAGINGSIIRSAGNIIINPGGIARGAAVAAAQAEGLSALILPGTDPQGKFRTYRLSVSGGMLQTYVYTGAMDPA